MTWLGDHISVGKLYMPDSTKYPETPQQYVRVVMAKLKEHLRMFPKLVSECPEMKYDQNTKIFTRVTGISADGRDSLYHYRGIEFDYSPIFAEYYKNGLDFNLTYRNRSYKGASKI